MKTGRLTGLLIGLALAGCVSAEMQQLPAATRRLQNGAFDTSQAASGIGGWAMRGEKYGRAALVDTPVVSAPSALKLTAVGPGSAGEQSFMLYQVLDPAPYRGRKVEFGAHVWTRGGAVTLTLYTPERTAQDFFDTLQSGAFVERRLVAEVPEQASFLSFGVQVFGPAGAEAIIDDVFVRVVGEEAPSVDASGGGSTGEGRARVRVNAAAPGRPVPDLLFGMHIEWAEQGNGLVDAAGALRPDVVDAFGRLRIPLFRFPGGIHADYYDWTRSVGPSSQRRPTRNVFSGHDEKPWLGSPEFVALLKATGAEALITANYGTGNAEDAAGWARWFRDAGVQPRFWEVGNEIYLADPTRDQPNGRRIHHPAATYARDVARFRHAIREALPDARVGAILHVDDGAFALLPRANRAWTSTVLDNLTGPVDFVSVHNGYAPVVIGDTERFDTPNARARVYRALLAAPEQTRSNLQEVARALDARPRTRDVPIAVTEFGPLFGISANRDMHAAYVDQSRTLAAAIYTASLLDVLLDDPRVLLATYTNPIHRWYGSLLTDTESGLIRTPTFHVYDWYRSRLRGALLPVDVESPTFDSHALGLVKARTKVPDLVAQAARNTDGRLAIVLVNRSLDRTLRTVVTVAGRTLEASPRCEVLTGPGPDVINGPSLTGTTRSGQIAPSATPCTVGASGIELVVGPHAIVSILEGGVE